MNISTLFQPVGDVALSGIPPRRFPPFLAVWGGQTEREAAFLNVKLHAARFRVCVSLLADRRITAAVCKQTLFQGGVVGADMDKGVFLVKPNIGGLFLLGKPCSHANSFLCPCYAIGAFFGCFLRLLTWRKTAFLTIKTARTWNVSSGRLLSQDFRFFRLLTVRRR